MPAQTSTTEELKDVVERVQDLCRLAQSDNENEARNSALKAVQLMNQHELAFVPRAQLESAMKTVEGAREMVKQAKQEKMQNMLVGGLLGAFLSKQFKLL